MYKQHSQITNNYVSIDLEIHPENNDLLKIGAVASKGNGNLCFQGAFDIPASMKELDEFCKNAEFIIGHNICDQETELSGVRKRSISCVDIHRCATLLYVPHHKFIKTYSIDGMHTYLLQLKETNLSEIYCSFIWGVLVAFN